MCYACNKKFFEGIMLVENEHLYAGRCMTPRSTYTFVTTRNVATPRNVAKKTLPEKVANFVGGYIFGEPHTQKCSRAWKNVAETDPTGNVATSPENVAAIDPTGNVATSPENVAGIKMSV